LCTPDFAFTRPEYSRSTHLGGEVDRELDHFRKEVLTEKNVRKLFVPIKNKEEALRYYLFLMKNLGAAWEDCVIYILKEDDYHSPELRQWIGNTQVYKQQLNNRTTRMEAIPDGYLLTLIGFNPTFRMEFFERKLEVHGDGTIQELSQKTLLDLSPKHEPSRKSISGSRGRSVGEGGSVRR